MKLMIAYDGSGYADAAVDDLRRAGLPRDSDVLVVSVVDVFDPSPPASEFDLNNLVSRRVEAVLTAARDHRERTIAERRNAAEAVVARLRGKFPEWTVASELLEGSPAAEILRRAGEWGPDLIIAGTQGLSAIGRFFLGSVSKTLAESAACSVRVVGGGAGEKRDGAIRVIVGVRGISDAAGLVPAVARREWPADTQMRLIAVLGGVPEGELSVAAHADTLAEIERAAGPLVEAGLLAAVEVKGGNPVTTALSEADAWNADAIFVFGGDAAAGWGLDEAAAALLARARCSIEIVR